MTLTWYRHFYRNGGLNQILKRQTPRFHYGSKVPAVTITVFITILEQNSCQSSTKFSEVNVKNNFTSHINKKIFLIFFVDFLIFIHFHYMKMHRLLSSLQRRNIFRQDLGIGIYTF
jgi:hypothetical protein